MPNGPLIELAWLHIKLTQLDLNYLNLDIINYKHESYVVWYVIGSSDASFDPSAHHPLFQRIAQSAC